MLPDVKGFRPKRERAVAIVLLFGGSALAYGSSFVTAFGAGCLLAGQVAPAYVEYALWIDLFRLVLFLPPLTALFIAFLGLIWIFIGATARQAGIAGAVLGLTFVATIALLIGVFQVGPVFVPGTQNCGLP